MTNKKSILEDYEFGELEINDTTVFHLHDKNGENWFDDNAGADLLDIKPRAYRKAVNKLEKDSESFGTSSTKTLKMAKTGRPRRFSNFEMIVRVAVNSKSNKAMRLVILAGNLLNEKYNQVQGYTSQQDTFVEDFQKNIDKTEVV